MNYFEYRNNFDDIKNIKSKLISGKTKKDNPVITIAIPTYKRPDLLKESIDSALNQKDFNDYEVIVVDNDDSINLETQKLIESYKDDKIFYYRNEKNLGMTGNWNRCIELSRGEWITILHDDDVLYSEFLSEMFKIVNCKKESIDLLVCSVECGNKIRPYIKIKKNVLRRISVERCILGSISPFPGIIFRKEKSILLGGFNQKFYPCSDYVFWSNYCMKFNAYCTNKVLAFYRLCETNTTSEVFNKIIDTSSDIKHELYKISLKNTFIKKILFKMGIVNLFSSYSIYINDKSIYYKKYNINSIYKNKIIFKVLNKIIRVLYRM